MRSQSLVGLSLLVCQSVLVAACAGDPHDLDDANQGELGGRLVVGEDQRQPLLNFDRSVARELRTAAAYGRAVARIPGCTASLVSDDVMITAAHCSVTGQSSFLAKFGRLESQAVTPLSETEARTRLRSLGFTTADAANASIESLTEFHCHTIRNEGADRDLVWARCVPNQVEQSVGSSKRWVPILPGHIWGHLEMAAAPAEGSRVVAVGATGGYLRLSPSGRLTDSHVSFGLCGGSLGHCFEHSADSEGGTSGGPIMNYTTGRVFGVQRGGEDWLVTETNVGTYLSSYADTVRAERARTVTRATSSVHSYADALGTVQSRGGTMRACDAGESARGVTFMYAWDDATGARYLANLSLVCGRVETYPTPMAFDELYAEHAESSALESLGTATRTKLNSYLREARRVGTSEQQRLALCPTGQVMAGITGYAANGGITRIAALRCVGLDIDGEVSRATPTPRTFPIHDTEYTPGTFASITCSEDRQVVNGMWLDQVHGRTNGVRLRCST